MQRKAQSGFGIVLVPGTLCEVNMQVLPPDVEGSGQFCCYPACLVDFSVETKRATIYLLHDTEQRLIPVGMDDIVKPTLPLHSEYFEEGDTVEVQYRVGETDEYGWWSAVVKEYDEQNHRYLVRWFSSTACYYADKVHVRKAAFK